MGSERSFTCKGSTAWLGRYPRDQWQEVAELRLEPRVCRCAAGLGPAKPSFGAPWRAASPGRCPGRTGREEEPGPGAPMTACPRPAPHFQEPALQVTQRVPLLSLRLPPPCFSARYHIMGQVPSDHSHCHFFLLSHLSFPSPDTTVLSFIPSSCNHPSPSPLRSRPLG